MLNASQWLVDNLTEDDLPVPLKHQVFPDEVKEAAKSMVSCFGDIDFDIVNLYFYKELSQSKIALILGLSQADVSYRISRAVAILKTQTSRDYKLYQSLLLSRKIVFSEEDTRILDLYLYLRNQTDVASRMSLSQSTISKRLLKIKSDLGKNAIKLF